MANRPRIVVLGSINMDLVATTPALPQPGETVMGAGFATLPGGKGANQAVAAARLGADVRMIGGVGDDTFGPMLLASLEANGVGVEDVMTTPGLSSGIAVILLDDERQNYIVGIYGANMACDELQSAGGESRARRRGRAPAANGDPARRVPRGRGDRSPDGRSGHP